MSVTVRMVEIEDKRAIGVKIELETAPFIMIRADNGVLSCGFINIEAAERIGIAAAMVSGVNTFEDVLEASVKALTTQARKRGIEENMSGREALLKLL